MIIIEGMDNAGKSTLINQLSEHFKLPYAHAHRSTAKSLEEAQRWHNWANACPKTLILDRHPNISDLVYGPIIRSTTAMTKEAAYKARAKHYLVFCCPNIQTIKATYELRDQMQGTHENLIALYDAYQDLMMELEPDFIYDFTNPRSYPTLLRNLTSALERM